MNKDYTGGFQNKQSTASGGGGTGGASVYEATVGATGADYTTLGAAITAGKVRVLVIDDTTETASITLPSNAIVQGYGTNININMGAYQFTNTANTNITFNDVKITHTSNALFDRLPSLYGKNIYIDNNGGTNSESISLAGGNTFEVDGLTLDLPNANNCGIQALDSDVSGLRISDLHIIGGGTSCYWGLKIWGNGCKINGIKLTGTFSTTAAQYVIELRGGIIDNIVSTSSSLYYMRFLNGTISNLFANNTGFKLQIEGACALNNVTANTTIASDIVIAGDDCVLNNISIGGSLTVNTGADRNSISNFNTVSTVSITGNDTTITGCKVGADAGGGANTITINAGANRTIISGTRTDVVISDAGTGTVGIANVIY